jgi:hypothetical protein
VWDRDNGAHVADVHALRLGVPSGALARRQVARVRHALRDQDRTLRLRNLETQAEEWLAFPVQRDDSESRAPMDAYPGYSFTPDSRAVVVSYGGEIWRVPVDRSAPVKIPFEADVKLEMGPEVKFAWRVDTATTFTAKQVRDIAPSPDGKQLAFSRSASLRAGPAERDAARV